MKNEFDTLEDECNWLREMLAEAYALFEANDSDGWSEEWTTKYTEQMD